MTDAQPPVISVAFKGGVDGHQREVAQFCDLMSVWPTGVAVVTATDRAGRHHGMTCNSLCSVSVAPPSLLVSLHVTSGTAAAIRDGGLFAVNFLRAGRHDVSQAFASQDPDRFRNFIWDESPHVRQPWLLDAAYALLECRLSSMVTVHDHLLLIGDVVNVRHSNGDALLYHARKYGSVPGVDEVDLLVT